MALHNLAQYKKAKVVVKELEKILKILAATEAGLKQYKHYNSVSFILESIYEHKPFIQIFLEEYKIILETKGQKGI